MLRQLIALVCAALAGCATTSGQQATTSRSGFDGARVVNIAPHGAACTTTLCTGLGAQWSSNRRDQAIVTVAVWGDYSPIAGAALNVDGTVHTFNVSPATTDFSAPVTGMRQSTRSFVVPLATVRAIAASQKTWLRVMTPGGSLEHAIIDGATDSKAYHALKRFLAEVEAGG